MSDESSGPSASLAEPTTTGASEDSGVTGLKQPLIKVIRTIEMINRAENLHPRKI